MTSGLVEQAGFSAMAGREVRGRVGDRGARPLVSRDPGAKEARDPQVIDHQGTGEQKHDDGIAFLLVAQDRREAQAESQRGSKQ